MRFTFGAFANVLWLCKTDVTDMLALVTALVQSVDEKCLMTSNAVTGLMKCNTGLPNGKGKDSLGDVVGKARTANHEKVADYFSENIIKPLIDTNKRKLVYCAIRKIILEDETILKDTVVDLVSGKTKKALRSQSRFALSHFLAGVFLYAVAVNNKEGKDTLPLITEAYINSFIKESESIGFMPPRPSRATITGNKAIFEEYMNRIQGDFSIIKTLLFKETPMKFYDIYLPNDIDIPKQANVDNARISRRQRLSGGNALSNVGISDLTRISNFLILKGTGGLGKSMMMKHLLLNAVDNFSQLSLVPIFVPLKEYNVASNGLLGYIHGIVANYCEEITEDIFKSALKDGSFLLLLDGIDEIDREHSAKFEREINAFVDKYPNNYYIMSSRPFHSFISFAKFSTLELCPFTKEQAIGLIGKLNFEPDQPEIKAKFKYALDESLYTTHRSFAEIPLLLTIMLMTFKYFAEVPSKMHLFYREAFLVLFRWHDASKGGYTREFKTGLDIDAFSNLFAEICFRSYRLEKFELLNTEVSDFFSASVKSAKIDAKFTVDDFMHDLCENLCIMYNEGGRYHFAHRSFQEYFAAVFMSRQSDGFIRKLGGFFEKRASRRYMTDSTFSMLFDIMQEKVEGLILVPYLEDLFAKCDDAEGYWTFLKILHPVIRYTVGTIDLDNNEAAKSFLFNFIRGLMSVEIAFGTEALPLVDEFVTDVFVPDEGWISASQEGDILPISEGSAWRSEMYVNSEEREFFHEAYETLDDDGFVFKRRYNAARTFLADLKAKQQSRQDDLLDLL